MLSLLLARAQPHGQPRPGAQATAVYRVQGELGEVGAEGRMVRFRTGRAFWDYPVPAPDFTYGTSQSGAGL